MVDEILNESSLNSNNISIKIEFIKSVWVSKEKFCQMKFTLFCADYPVLTEMAPSELPISGDLVFLAL